MLAISPHTKLSFQIDTLRTLTDSTLSNLQVQSIKMDSVCDTIARFSDGQVTLYGEIDSIQTQIQSIPENGVGYSDVLGHIAIPLIMAQFNKTLIIMRFADLPVLVPISKDEKPVVTIVDETSREKGWAPVRVTADPCLLARYCKNAEVIRVRFTKK